LNENCKKQPADIKNYPDSEISELRILELSL